MESVLKKAALPSNKLCRCGCLHNFSFSAAAVVSLGGCCDSTTTKRVKVDLVEQMDTTSETNDVPSEYNETSRHGYLVGEYTDDPDNDPDWNPHCGTNFKFTNKPATRKNSAKTPHSDGDNINVDRRTSDNSSDSDSDSCSGSEVDTEVDETKTLRFDETKKLRFDETKKLRFDETKKFRFDKTKKLRFDETKKLRFDETKKLRFDETKKLRCQSCDYRCRVQMALRCHVTKKHHEEASRNGKHICRECGQVEDTMEALQQHKEVGQLTLLMTPPVCKK